MGILKMLCNLIKRGLIYGYFIFIGYQLFTTLATNKQFTESITRFETQHEKHFSQIYQKIPQLVQFKFAKYPVALLGFSALSILLGGFGIFALLTHALITYISNERVVGYIRQINPQMNVIKFAQSIDLETILMIVIYLGVLCQVIYSIFGSSCRTVTVEEPVAEPTRTSGPGSSSRGKKRIH